jgi:hypothetical protein
MFRSTQDRRGNSGSVLESLRVGGKGKRKKASSKEKESRHGKSSRWRLTLIATWASALTRPQQHAGSPAHHAPSLLPPWPPTYSWTRDTKSRIQQRYAQQRCQGEGNKDSGTEQNATETGSAGWRGMVSGFFAGEQGRGMLRGGSIDVEWSPSWPSKIADKRAGAGGLSHLPLFWPADASVQRPASSVFRPSRPQTFFPDD